MWRVFASLVGLLSLGSGICLAWEEPLRLPANAENTSQSRPYDDPPSEPPIKGAIPDQTPVLVAPPSPAPQPLFLSGPLPEPGWGDYLHPFTPLTGAPPFDYELAHLPVEVGNQYEDTHRLVLSNPEQVFAASHAAWSNIDLLRPDGLAPIGMIGDHTLNAGGQMLFSYRYNVQSFSGNRDGTHEVSDADVLSQFPLAANHLQVQRHFAMMEFAPSENLTLLAQLPFVQINMDSIAANGSTIRNSATDPGDITLMAMYVLARWGRHQVHLNMGSSLPVAVFRRFNYDPSPTNPDFSYPLYLGSGTFDWLPGITYRGQSECWTWGGQALGTVRFGRNNLGFRYGDQVDLTAWAARRLTERLSASFRLDGLIWGNLHAANPDLNQALIQTNRPDLQGGQRLNALAGLSFMLPAGQFPSQRIAIEGGAPLFQSLSGPQLSQGWVLTAGWQLLF